MNPRELLGSAFNVFGCLVRAVHAGDFVGARFDQAVFSTYIGDANREASRRGQDATLDELAAEPF